MDIKLERITKPIMKFTPTITISFPLGFRREPINLNTVIAITYLLIFSQFILRQDCIGICRY